MFQVLWNLRLARTGAHLNIGAQTQQTPEGFRVLGLSANLRAPEHRSQTQRPAKASRRWESDEAVLSETTRAIAWGSTCPARSARAAETARGAHPCRARRPPMLPGPLRPARSMTDARQQRRKLLVGARLSPRGVHPPGVGAPPRQRQPPPWGIAARPHCGRAGATAWECDAKEHRLCCSRKSQCGRTWPRAPGCPSRLRAAQPAPGTRGRGTCRTGSKSAKCC